MTTLFKNIIDSMFGGGPVFHDTLVTLVAKQLSSTNSKLFPDTTSVIPPISHKRERTDYILFSDD